MAEHWRWIPERPRGSTIPKETLLANATLSVLWTFQPFGVALDETADLSYGIPRQPTTIRPPQARSMHQHRHSRPSQRCFLTIDEVLHSTGGHSDFPSS
ncbi:hypothetical protein KM043_008397 [Ampulex compressa]|nr:hypothetical protein KM043_008397 [Ampulex compressa]